MDVSRASQTKQGVCVIGVILCSEYPLKTLGPRVSRRWRRFWQRCRHEVFNGTVPSLWVDETVKNCRSSWRLTSILEDYRLLWADSFITYSGWGMDPLVKTEMLEEWKVVEVTWCITLLVETCQSIHRKCHNDSRNQCCVDISLMIHDWNTNVVEYCTVLDLQLRRLQEHLCMVATSGQIVPRMRRRDDTPILRC